MSNLYGNFENWIFNYPHVSANFTQFLFLMTLTSLMSLTFDLRSPKNPVAMTLGLTVMTLGLIFCMITPIHSLFLSRIQSSTRFLKYFEDKLKLWWPRPFFSDLQILRFVSKCILDYNINISIHKNSFFFKVVFKIDIVESRCFRSQWPWTFDCNEVFYI